MHDAIAFPVEESGTEKWVPDKVARKARRLSKRQAHQVERTRIRENLQAGLKDPEVFLDLESQSKNIRRLLASGKAERQALLQTQKRKARAELANTRDLDTFLAKSSRSRTLYSLVALAYFRHVLRSDEYREDHRYKEAIRRALEEPGLAKSIQKRWGNFDRQFPGQLKWERAASEALG
jgi:hypothetical protein